MSIWRVGCTIVIACDRWKDDNLSFKRAKGEYYHVPLKGFSGIFKWGSVEKLLTTIS